MQVAVFATAGALAGDVAECCLKTVDQGYKPYVNFIIKCTVSEFTFYIEFIHYKHKNVQIRYFVEKRGRRVKSEAGFILAFYVGRCLDTSNLGIR